MTTAIRARDQTTAEEIANSLSHGIGFLLAWAALPVLVNAAAQRGRAAARPMWWRPACSPAR